jgi:hypothetical protein
MANRVKLFTKLREEMKDAGCSENQIHYAREICREYNKNYIDQEKTRFGFGSGVDSSLENLNPEVLDPFTQEENLTKVEDLDEVYQKIRYAKDRIEKYADANGKALVNHEPNRAKISTEPDANPGESSETFAIDKCIAAIDDIPGLLKSVRTKVFLNPAHNATKEEHEEMSAKIESFARICDTFGKFLRSCVDEKYSFTLWGHAIMRADIDARSKHGAAVKAVIQLMRDGRLVDEWRKMTRERAGDEAEQILQWMIDMTEAMQDSAYWDGFITWRDRKSTLNNRIASRKVDLSPDLSEKAIG